MTDPKIITDLRAIRAPGSCHLDVRLSCTDIEALLAGWDALQSAREDAEMSESLTMALLDRARPDAERYRWLMAGEYIGQNWRAADYRWNGCDGKAGFDAAIDAVMKEKA